LWRWAFFYPKAGSGDLLKPFKLYAADGAGFGRGDAEEALHIVLAGGSQVEDAGFVVVESMVAGYAGGIDGGQDDADVIVGGFHLAVEELQAVGLQVDFVGRVVGVGSIEVDELPEGVGALHVAHVAVAHVVGVGGAVVELLHRDAVAPDLVGQALGVLLGLVGGLGAVVVIQRAGDQLAQGLIEHLALVDGVFGVLQRRGERGVGRFGSMPPQREVGDAQVGVAGIVRGPKGRAAVNELLEIGNVDRMTGLDDGCHTLMSLVNKMFVCLNPGYQGACVSLSWIFNRTKVRKYIVVK